VQRATAGAAHATAGMPVVSGAVGAADRLVDERGIEMPPCPSSNMEALVTLHAARLSVPQAPSRRAASRSTSRASQRRSGPGSTRGLRRAGAGRALQPHNVSALVWHVAAVDDGRQERQRREKALV
jgi:hypothetical protein